METLYRKVAVSERTPKKNGRYFAWINEPNADNDEDRMCKTIYKDDFGFQSFYEVTHWLEEIPNNIDTNDVKKKKASIICCPFCGSNGKTIHKHYQKNYQGMKTSGSGFMDMEARTIWFVRCDNNECKMNPCTPYQNTKEDAIKCWNTREIPDPTAQLQADKAELLEALEASNEVLTNCSFEINNETSYQIRVALSHNQSILQKHQ